MENYGEQINNLISQFSKLPGVGKKSAIRLAFYIISQPLEDVKALSSAIITAREKIRYCEQCCAITDEELCPVCRDTKRDQYTIMVVETTKDMMAYEKTNQYNGLYHVLNGSISPKIGKGPEDITLDKLENRINDNSYEIIIATNNNLDGEMTAIYIRNLLEKKNVNVTRIASGVPVGGNLENIDEITLLKALRNRNKL